MLFTKLLFLGGISAVYSAALPPSNGTCKANPIDFTWPKESEWLSLNKSIGGLIATSPVASSCWNNTNFESPYSCSTVQANWSSSVFHQNQPESIGAPLYANNSCLPTGVSRHELLAYWASSHVERFVVYWRHCVDRTGVS